MALGRRWGMGCASTFPSRWWEGIYRLFALFSWWVEAWRHRYGRMLRIALPSNFTHCQGKPECLSKGFGTELTSENSEIIKQRHIAPGWLSHTIPCPPEQGSASPPVADLLPVSCLQLIPISGEKWVDPGRDAQSPQRLIERGQSCHSAR